MIVDLPVKCVSKKLCSNCEFIDLTSDTLKMTDGYESVGTITEIRCRNYELCSRMLRYLNLAADDSHDDFKFTGRDGD
jgi:hypothetical protein